MSHLWLRCGGRPGIWRIRSFLDLTIGFFLTIGKLFAGGVGIFFQSAKDDDVAVVQFGQARWDGLECLEDALMHDFPVWVGPAIEVGARGDGLHDMDIALGIKKDLS